MTSEPNDCSLCAVLNVLAKFGISLAKEEIKPLARFDSSKGGFDHIALKCLAEKNNLSFEFFPKDEHLIFRQINEHVKRAFPEDNAKTLLAQYIQRLKAGWRAVTSIKWASGEGHSIALIGATEDKVIVADSVKGVYEIGEELFFNPEGKMQAGIFTCWVKEAAVDED